MGGWQLAHAVHGGQRSRHVPEREVAVERDVVDLTRDLVIVQQRTQLRCERQHAVADAVDQRLLADSIAGDEKLLPAVVPQREREHAVQVADAVGAVLLVQMHDHFRVAVRGEAVPSSLQRVTQLAVVVDLAVQDDDYGAVLVVDRLVAGIEIDDAQPLDPESDVVLVMDPARVGAPVLQPCAHSREELGRHPVAPRTELSYDPAHPLTSRRVPRSRTLAPAPRDLLSHTRVR
jgi:hypothetical protein